MLLWATHVDEKPLSEGDRRHLLDFLAVLNRSQREADLNPVPASLADWRVTMEAGLLAEAGFDHVLIGSDWVDGLSPSQRARLDDPSHYEVIDRWWHPVEEQAYTLYRIVG
jgi:hypothetical protein